MSKLLTQDQIKELILEKEKQDAIFKHNMEVEAEKTQELFSKIKDDFLNYAIEECILRDYKLYDCNVDFCTAKAINKNYDLKLENVSPLTLVEVEDVLGEVDSILLSKNLTNLLLQNGFNLRFRGLDLIYSTSKEALLRLNEPLNKPKKDFSVGKIEPVPKRTYDDPSETKWVGLFLIIVVVATVLGFILI